MIKYNIILLFFIFLFTQCVGPAANNKGSDTAEILKIIWDAKQINNHLVPLNRDSIYIIKNKYINQQWSKHANRFKITYIENTKAAIQPNYLNSDTLDKRIRLNVPKFDIVADSATVTLYNFNFGSEIKFSLVKQNSKWLIKKAIKGME